MGISETAYQKVTAYLKKHPGKTASDAARAVGVKASHYYSRVSELRKKEARRFGRNKTQAAAAVMPIASNPPGKLMVLIGTPDQIREVIQ